MSPTPGGSWEAAFARWAPTAITALVLFVDATIAGGFAGGFGLPLWAWIAPVVALAFALIGPRPGWGWPRDGFAFACLLAGFARAFLPHAAWPREIRYGLGATATAGIVLLFTAYAFGDGFGGTMRRFAAGRLGRGLRRIQHQGGRVLWLAVCAAMVIFALIQPATPRWWAILPIAMVAAALLPPRWRRVGQGVQIVGCLPLPVLGIGSLTGAWSPGTFFFVLFSMGLAHAIETLREPIPAPTPSVVETEREGAVVRP